MPAIAIVFGVVLVFVFAARASAAAGRPAAPSGAIDRVANAIAIAEGFYVPQSVPSRANNPGDLKLGGDTLGATGITVFSSSDEGWIALYSQLEKIRDGQSQYYKPWMTISQVGNTYAGNAGGVAWASNVARSLGVDVQTTIGAVLA